MSKHKRSSLGISLTCAVILFIVTSVKSAPTFQSPTNETSEPPDVQPVQPSGSYLKNIRISGLRIENVDDISISPFLGYNEKRHSIIKPGELVQVVIFGTGFNEFGAVTFTADRSCKDRQEYIESDFSIITNTRMSVSVAFEELKENEVYHLCVSERLDRRRQNFVIIEDAFTVITTKIPPKALILPMGISIPFLLTLLVLSGLFSGLNLGLMTLSPFELQLYKKSGTPKERACAEKIYPIRKRGNVLLCTLLIGNVVVNSAISLLLDDVFGNGGYALLLATIGITIFGEIVPQAICVKRGLEVGAMTVPLTRVIMLLMFPITFFIGLFLDYFLKEEFTQPLGKDKLVEMIKLSGLPDELREEFKMALGALLMGDKMAKDSMTRIEHAFMLPSTLTLNPVTVNQILEMGYTRIPIFENDRNNVVAMLSVKDLALLDPDDNVNVMTVCRVYNRVVRHVAEDTPLRVLLKEFKRGDYHLAMVFQIVTSEDSDPSYEISGLITLEDIIEEILQTEIIDETDTVLDNVQRKTRHRERHHDMSQIMQNIKCVLGIQMQVCTLQFLPFCHEAFESKYIHPYILEKLIRQHSKKVETSHLLSMVTLGAALPKPAVLYTNGQVSDKFIVILQGTVTVEIGKDKMVLEAGQWHAFGKEILDGLVEQVKKDNEGELNINFENQAVQFVPDFTVVVRNECVFLEVAVSDWQAAYKASILAKKYPQEVAVRVTTNQCSDDLTIQEDKLNEIEKEEEIKEDKNENTTINGDTVESPLIAPPRVNIENVNDVEISSVESTPTLNRSVPPLKPPRAKGSSQKSIRLQNGDKKGYHNGEEIELLPPV